LSFEVALYNYVLLLLVVLFRFNFIEWVSAGPALYIFLGGEGGVFTIIFRLKIKWLNDLMTHVIYILQVKCLINTSNFFVLWKQDICIVFIEILCNELIISAIRLNKLQHKLRGLATVIMAAFRLILSHSHPESMC